ncbi:glycosyltransferase family 2 protein [Phormidium sp. LEGE 05292]|uniref:glycosyltransferase family 2 protein n=1 Tax=[Phormidium] sp. LEGE 05292 TaxID=767427 RepID=UPI001880A7AC|nr:glycosyltransferase family 2 protein [Phormidium sp. LEGE 05292]MBE9224081.1 glycosyltransferase family 2 protein [Phormidium sp. LEGE 05292]
MNQAYLTTQKMKSMNPPPKVLVIILNWNQKYDTIGCLNSLKKIDYPNYHIIVIDNNSSDDSVNAILQAHPTIRVYKQQDNYGCAGGRNIGLKYADHQADYILFLDNDTKVSPKFLTYLIETAEQDLNIGVVSSMILYWDDPSIAWTSGGSIDKNGIVTALYYNEPTSNIPNALYKVDWVPGCVLLAKKSVFEEISDFNENYFIYFEDVDWCLKAKQAGYHVVVDPRSVVYHKASQSLGGETSLGKLYYMTRNRLLFVSQYYRGIKAFRSISLILVEEFLNIVDQLRMKNFLQSLIKIKAIFHFFVGKKGALSEQNDKLKHL